MSTRVLPGAEPFFLDGGPSGILILHGFTGNPSAFRPLGESLAARGLAVACPRLPGHGTVWRDLAQVTWEDWADEAERTFDELRARCDAGIVVFGASMGAALALRLAARRPEEVAGLVLVNPYVRDQRLLLVPAGRLVVRSIKGVGDDIAKSGETEKPYERIPVRVIGQLVRLLKATQRELTKVRAPILVFRSLHDHVVPKGNARFVLDRVASEETELVELPDSFHVAWIDHDRETIFERTADFVGHHTGG